MPRLLFEKRGRAVWISHLDLMRLFQRAFKRADLLLTHTQGFNPRPSVSIALPLSVGVSSECELLDFDLDGNPVSDEEICARLNAALVDGVSVRKVYRDARKIKELSRLKCQLTLEYDNGIPQNAAESVRELFSRQELLVEKKSKNGIAEQNIIPMIYSLNTSAKNERELVIDAVISCQNPSLNPMQIHAAIIRYLPMYTPDFATYHRVEIYDQMMTQFR